MRIALLSIFLVASVPSLLSAATNTLSTSSFLSEADKARLVKVIEPGFDLKDLSALHYAVLGYKYIGRSIPKTAELCKYLISSAGNGNDLSLENIFYVATTWKALGSCQNLPTASLSKTLMAVLEKDTSTIPELYYAVGSLVALSQKISDSTSAKLVKTLQTALRKDDSLSNLGYAFHIASDLGTSGAFAFDRIEDAVVQADEVDGKQLQFEGGLSVTGLLISGIYKLSASLKKKTPISLQQSVKFANYFLSRRSVQTPKGVASLLLALTTLADKSTEKPTCITLVDGGIVVSSLQPLVKVKICDILGRPLPVTPTVVANSATRVGDDVVVISKESFKPDASDKTLFTMNFMDIKPDRGFYKISITAASVSNSVTVKVLSEVVVDYLDIGTGDADQTTQPQLSRIAYPNKLSQKIEADSQQKVVIRFSLKDAANKKAMRVHQAFVRLSSVAESKERHGEEIIFVAEPDASHLYKFDMPVGSAAANFGHQSGDYKVELIVGDALLSNSFQWPLAVVGLKFPDQTGATVAEKQTSTYKLKHNLVYTPKPEIKHMFREPEKRPPAFVSNLFTGLCLAPVLLLLIIWAKLGVNVSNFPISVSAVSFHIGLGSIFVLFGVFWLKLNMFVTLRYLLGLGIVTFLAGNKLLSRIARNRKSSSR